MEEILRPHDEYQLKGQTQDTRLDYPEFDPEKAQALKNEQDHGHTEIDGLAVSAEEAREIGEMPLGEAGERRKNAKEFLESGLANGEIVRVDVSSEQQIEANREAFFDIQKRRAFIAKLYPVLTENRDWDDPELNAVPDSVYREFSFGGSIIRHMTTLSPFNVPSKKMLQYESGIILPEYHSYEDADNMLAYEEAKEINDKIFDQDALANFSPHEGSVKEQEAKTAALIDKIHSIRTRDELEQIRVNDVSKMYRFEEEANIDVLKRRGEAIRSVIEELIAQENQIRIDENIAEYYKQQAVVEKIQAEKAQLEAEYKNANLFKRIKMLRSGYNDKIDALEADIEINSGRAAAFYTQYKNILKALDSERIYKKAKEERFNIG